MELTHRFSVPVPVDVAWAHFNDIASVAECFPGATVSSADGDSFQGSVKVKLGPIALVYNGSGTFTEKDEAAHRFVVDAKGKDKRGNGTAGALVTLTMADSGGSTDVQVVTDLAITGKPAQFGRGVMQDVSDKLLGQFVDCLHHRLAEGQAEGQEEPAAPEAAVEEPPAVLVRDVDAVGGGDDVRPAEALVHLAVVRERVEVVFPVGPAEVADEGGVHRFIVTRACGPCPAAGRCDRTGETPVPRGG